MLLPREQQLPDGSYLTHIYATQPDSAPTATARRSRVVEYRLDDPALAEEEQRYRLITTILDPDAAPASELAALYPSAGSSRARSTSSKPTSAARASCCAQSTPTASTKKPTATSAPTTRSAA